MTHSRFLIPSLPPRVHRLKPMPSAAPLALLLLGLALTVGGCGEQGLSADAHVSKAERHIAAGDLRAGVIELKNAIQQDPDDLNSRLLLGTSYLTLGDPLGAEKELMRARELGAPAEEVLVPLARAWNGQGAFDKTLKEVVLEDTPSGPSRLDALVVRAHAHRGLGQLDAARVHLDEALALAPDHPPALIERARLAIQQEDLGTAAVFVDRARAAAPEQTEVWTVTGDLALAAGRPAEAVAAFEKVTRDELAPFGLRLALAQARIANEEFEAAIVVLDELHRQAPDHPAVNYLRALAAYQTEEFETAKAFGQKVLARVPHHLDTFLIIGGAHFALGENEQAVDRLKSFVASVPGHAPARRLLGAALLRAGDPAGARQILRPLVGERDSGDDAALLAMIGAAAVRSGDLAGGKTYLQRLAQAQPDNAMARAQLGVVRLDLGEIDEGFADLEQAVRQDPGSQALAVLAIGSLRAGRLDKALEAAQKLAEEDPQSPLGPTLAGIALASSGKPDQARAAFEQARALDPAAPGAGFNLAALEFKQGRPEAAHRILLETLDKNPKDPQVLHKLGTLETLLGDPAARSRFVELLTLEPDNLSAKIALAQLHLQDGEPQRALDLTERLHRADPANLQLAGVVGQAYLAAGRPHDAAAVFRGLIAAHPDAVVPRLALAQALATAGEQGQAREQLETILALDPPNQAAGLALARLASAEGDWQRAERMLAALEGTAADSADVLELRGDIALAAGRLDEATHLYRRVLDSAPTGMRLMKLAAVERRAGNPNAPSILQDWLADHPDDVAVRLALADARLAAQDNAAARQEYERIITIDPQNVVARNNLAWLLWQAGEVNAALPHVTTALELAPDSPQVQDTAGMVFLAAGDAARAVGLLRKAAEASPQDATIHYHLAQALHATGEVQQARQVLEQVLGVGEPFPERQQAEALFRQLKG